jgi:hypothetical protein
MQANSRIQGRDAGRLLGHLTGGKGRIVQIVFAPWWLMAQWQSCNLAASLDLPVRENFVQTLSLACGSMFHVGKIREVDRDGIASERAAGGA